MHNLTEIAAFVPFIEVPDATDDGATRHTAAQTLAQGLGNRTQYLKTVTDRAVLRTGASSQSIDGSIAIAGDLTVGGATVDAGSADATFNTVRANLQVMADTLTVGTDALFGGSIGAGANIESTGTITSGSDVLLPAAKRVKYVGSASDRQRFRRIRLAGASTNNPTAVQFTGNHWIVGLAAYTLSIPLPYFPTATAINAVFLQYGTSGAAAGTFELIRSNIGTVSWAISTGGAVPLVTSLGSVNLVTAGTGVKVAQVTLGTPEVISNVNYDYWLLVTGDAGSNHDIYGAAVSVSLDGPGAD